MVEERFTYHGYRLMWCADGVAIWYGSSLICVEDTMSAARSVIDVWRDAR